MPDTYDESTFTPLAVAKELGVNSHTIRRWCADHAAFLSEGANPAKGKSRKLTTQDIEVLREVQRLRAEELQTPAINERLAGVVFAQPAPIIAASPATQEGHGETVTALTVVSAVQSALAPVEARLQALEQAQRVSAAQRRPTWGDVVWIAVATFIAGAIMASAWSWFR